MTPYVAEFFNSTTSLFIVASGVLPLLFHQHMWDVLEVSRGAISKGVFRQKNTLET